MSDVRSAIARIVLVPALAGMVLSGLPGLTAEGQARVPPKNNRLAALQVTFELASDFDSGDAKYRENILSVIDERGSASDQEIVSAHAAFKAPPDNEYHSLTAAEASAPYAYIRAMRSSYAKYQGALSAGDKDWAAKQLKATQLYAEMVANSILAEAKQDDGDVTRLQRVSFAVRRSPADQAAFLDRLKKTGLTLEHRKLMLESGRTEAEITAFQEQLLKLSPDKVGASPVEVLSHIAASRRELAAELIAFAQATPAALTGPVAQTFLVGNPHDREETVDLFIRPISIPPDWILRVVNAEEHPMFTVREADPGKHYVVTLPAKGQVTVASVVIPVGDLGVNTTARWAVEGKIGDELIGGMVHEIDVPYAVASLQLPPIGSAPVTGSAQTSWLIYAAIAALFLILLAGAWLTLTRRRVGATR